MTTHVQYRDFLLPDDGALSSYKTDEDRTLEGLSLINLFVGPNNAGKSRLLRCLFASKGLDYTSSEYDASVFKDFIEKHTPEYESLFPNNITSIGKNRRDALSSLHGAGNESRFLSVKDSVYDAIQELIDGMKTSDGGITFTGMGSTGDQGAHHKRMQEFGHKLGKEFSTLPYDTRVFETKRFYIPILRGMRPLGDGQANLYYDRTINDYFKGRDSSQVSAAGDQIVFTGLELYQVLKAHLLGEPEQRDSIAAYQDFLSRHFFNSERVTLIPRDGDNTVHVLIGKDKQRPIYQLGDGLQNLIIITYNMFLESKRCLFFIEEPDMCMHPGLQRALLEAMSG